MKDLYRIQNIFFDFDGTIMDTSEGIKNGFSYALKKFGKELPQGDFYRRLIGPPLSESFEHILGFKKEEVSLCIDLYREYYAPKGLYEVSVYKGIPELLEKLKKSGKKVCIASSKPKPFVEELLRKFSLDQYFDFVSASDMNEKNASKALIIKKAMDFCRQVQEIGTDDFLMIGDRKYDMIGAKENSIRGAGALWGFGTQQELEDAGASVCFENAEAVAKQIITDTYSAIC